MVGILKMNQIDVRMLCFLSHVEDALCGRISVLVINHRLVVMSDS